LCVCGGGGAKVPARGEAFMVRRCLRRERVVCVCAPGAWGVHWGVCSGLSACGWTWGR
jgi:hypothetical protein